MTDGHTRPERAFRSWVMSGAPLLYLALVLLSYLISGDGTDFLFRHAIFAVDRHAPGGQDFFYFFRFIFSPQKEKSLQTKDAVEVRNR